MTADRRVMVCTRVVLLILLVAASLLMSAGPAAAHAVLVSAVPGDGEQLAAAPEDITLEFNEPVALPDGGLRLFDSSGAAIDLGPMIETPPTTVRVPVARSLDQGSYIATWRVVSADGHPVRGALVFSVGDPEQVTPAVMSEVFGSDADRPVAVIATVVRWALYLGVLVAAGGVAFLLWVAGPRDRAALSVPARGAAVVGGIAALVSVPLQAAQVSGQGMTALTRMDLLSSVLRGSVGLQSLLVVLALGVLAVALRHCDDRLARALALAGAVAALGALLVTGHTRTTTPAWPIMTADLAHVAAAAIWLGGLALLVPAVRRRRRDDDPTGAARAVARFSTLATVAVLILTAAGLALAYLLVRTTGALLTTAYGRILLVKVGLAAVVLLLGAYNNRRLVPAVRRSVTPAAPPAGDPTPSHPDAGGVAVAVAAPTAERATRAWSLLARTVRWEIGGLAVVVAVTAALVNVQPAAEAAGVTGAYSTVAPIGRGYELTLVVDPNQVGVNQVHLYLLDATGRPVAAEQLRLRMSLPANDIGPIVRTASPISTGHWVHVGPELAVPGRWQIEAQVTVSQFERPSATVEVGVRP